MKTINEQLKELFESNDDLFIEAIEELDCYNGYLGDNRYYRMEDISEFYADTDPLEMLSRAFYGYDADNYITDEYGRKEHREFNPNREYFTYNGYGNLISTDYKDYSCLLDDYFIADLIENYESLYLDNEILEIIEGAEEDDNE